MIVTKPRRDLTLLSSVPVGDCFFVANGYYMKIESFQGNENAVHLQSGKCIEIENGKEVMLLHMPTVSFG